MIDEEELVAAARRGDRSAFATLYERHFPSVYRYAYFQTPTAADAEDASADAFLRAIEHVDRFHGGAAQFGGWLFRITRNVIIDRARRTRPAVALDEATDAAIPDGAGEVVQRVALRAALATLKEEQRSAVVLRFVVGLSSREAGAVLGKSEGAVEQLQRRGLAALAKVLGSAEPRSHPPRP
ncbi:MAG TPA: RNA polymerase sigma factor [Candidatus Limnocylindria bacterium]|nr:RNA polymerase sigma factor [Candidatus Limnocylindria bacterium]